MGSSKKYFKHVKVKVAKMSAENEIFAFDVGGDVLHVLYGLLADCLFVFLNIALKVQRLFQRREDAGDVLVMSNLSSSPPNR